MEFSISSTVVSLLHAWLC